MSSIAAFGMKTMVRSAYISAKDCHCLRCVPVARLVVSTGLDVEGSAIVEGPAVVLEAEADAEPEPGPAFKVAVLG
jgi:hypothetical protein